MKFIVLGRRIAENLISERIERKIVKDTGKNPHLTAKDIVNNVKDSWVKCIDEDTIMEQFFEHIV